MYACSTVTAPAATIPIPSAMTPFLFPRRRAMRAAGSRPSSSRRRKGMSWRKVRVSVSRGTIARFARRGTAARDTRRRERRDGRRTGPGS